LPAAQLDQRDQNERKKYRNLFTKPGKPDTQRVATTENGDCCVSGNRRNSTHDQRSGKYKQKSSVMSGKV